MGTNEDVLHSITINEILCSLKISADRLKAFISFSQLDKLTKENLESLNWINFDDQLCDWIEQFLDVEMVDDRSLKSAIDSLKQTLIKETKDSKIAERKISQGIAPTIPKDGKYILLVKPYTENFSGGYDLSNKFQKRFDSVLTNAPVIRVYPPKKGDPGKDVKGMSIPALEGNPCNLVIGEGLVEKKDSSKAYSELLANKDGYLKIDSSNNAIISDKIEIKSDIDHHTGSIDFSGSILIKGTVRPGFSVFANKEIEITEDVLDSSIKSIHGDIKIKGKVLGTDMLKDLNPVNFHEDDFRRIEVGNNFNCDELQSYAVFTKGNILVSKNVSRSMLCSAGGVIIEKSLFSSRVRTVCGLQVSTLGNDSEAPNLIEILSINEASREYLLAKEKLEKLIHQEGILNTFLGPYANDMSAIKKLSNIHRSKLEVTLKKLVDIKKLISLAQLELDNFSNDNKSTKSSNVNIIKLAYPGTIIRAENKEYFINELLKGPFTISYNFESKEFLKQDLLPLECIFNNK